jgi:hypothetical protein
MMANGLMTCSMDMGLKYGMTVHALKASISMVRNMAKGNTSGGMEVCI